MAGIVLTAMQVGGSGREAGGGTMVILCERYSYGHDATTTATKVMPDSKKEMYSTGEL
jgi:hypothetical protein